MGSHRRRPIMSDIKMSGRGTHRAVRAVGHRRGRTHHRLTPVGLVLAVLVAAFVVPSAARILVRPALAAGPWTPTDEIDPIDVVGAHAPVTLGTATGTHQGLIDGGTYDEWSFYVQYVDADTNVQPGGFGPAQAAISWGALCSDGSQTSQGGGDVLYPGSGQLGPLYVICPAATPIVDFQFSWDPASGPNPSFVSYPVSSDPVAGMDRLRALGLGSANPAANVQTCGAPTTDPVTCSSGNFSHTATDVSIPGRGGGLVLSRTYNALLSGKPDPYGFGGGWSCSYCMSLSTAVDGSATVTDGSGSAERFTSNGSGGFITPGYLFATLVHNGDGTYTYKERNRETYTFDSSGQLTSLQDTDGNVTTIGNSPTTLSSVTDSAGRTLTIVHGPAGITSVTDPLGRVTSYWYNYNSQLASVTDPAGNATQYTYDSQGRLATMIAPSGATVTNTYDGNDSRIASQTDALGRVTSFAYTGDNFGPDGGTTTITDPTGMVTVEAYTNGALTSLTKGYGTSAPSTWTYTIDPTTLATTGVTDPDGYSSSQTYDSNGFLASATDANGHTSSFTNDSLGDVLTSTDPAGVTTTHTYTATGDLASTSTPVGTGTVSASFAHGDPTHPGDVTSSTDPNGHVTSYGHDSYGDVSSVTNPDGNATSATFDADGEKLTSVAADGNVSGCSCATAYTTTYAYYPNGLLHTLTDPLGEVTTNGYDVDSNLTTVTDPTGKVTTNTYDLGEQLTKVTQPDGSYVTYGYDGDGRRNSVKDDTDPATTTTFDALGDPLTVTDPTGAVTTNTYDLDGRLTQTTAPNGGVTHDSYDHAGQLLSRTSPTSGLTSTTYDVDGRAHTVTDPDSNTTTYAYDALGRQTITTRADTTTTTNAYDNDGHVTSYTDGAGYVTSYVFDPAGRETSSTDPDSRTTSYGYDATGNQTTITDPTLRVTTNTFDHASQLTGISYSDPGTHAVSYGYDAAGRRTTMTDGTGTTTYGYDSYGRLSSVTAPAGVTGYSYDTLGRIATVTYPDTHVVTRGYDAADRLSSVQDWNSHTTTFGYDGDGNQTTTTYPNGVIDTTTVNLADQPTAITVRKGATSLASFGYTPDAAGQLSASTDSLDSALSTSYGYTALNQVKTVASATSHYVYDSSGNLTGLTDGTALTYDHAGQVQTSTPSGGTASTFGFDGVGDRTTTSAPNPGTPGTIGSEVNSSADAASGAGTVTAGTFSTTHTNEVFLALVSAGPGTGTQTATVSGAGLTWTMVARANTQAGDAEIWSAPAPAILAHVSVTATQAHAGGKLSLEVMSFYGASGVGAHATANAATGAAHVSVTTTGTNSRTFAVGYDGTATGATTVATGQTLTHSQSTSGATGNTWMQKTTSATAASGTAVNLADTAPTTLAWNMAAVEVLATPIPAAPTVTTDTYNQPGELTSTVKTGGTATTYTYNGDGLRTSSTLSSVTTNYAWDTQADNAELLSDATNDYIYGPAGNVVEQVAKTSGTTSYLHTDRIGSVRLVTTSTGTAGGTTSYDPYGNLVAHTGTSTTPFGFSGEYTDATGLVYLRARYYDPATGQFLTVDPAVDATKSAYGYTAGDPLNNTDASGMTCDGLFGCIGHFVASTASTDAEYWSAAASNCAREGVSFNGGNGCLDRLDGVHQINTGAREINAGCTAQGVNDIINGTITAGSLAAAPFGGLETEAAGGLLTTDLPTAIDDAGGRAARLPQDVNVSPRAPDPLPLKRPVGLSPTQNAFVQRKIALLRSEEATDIRVNQQQVNINGERVGVNRPDLQYTLDGQRYYDEFDTDASTRGEPHGARIYANDPAGIVNLYTVN